MFSNKYNGKSVLVTGHTGFKGSWLITWLRMLGANVSGFSIGLPSEPCNFQILNLENDINNYFFDIKNAKDINDVIKECKPDFVFHLAAQALVRKSYQDPIETIFTNALGSVHVLDALRMLDHQVTAIFITSDKVYDNVEWVWGYKESDKLGGKDPYSASKGMAELSIYTYYNSFFKNNSNVNIGIARAGNVIGGGDWAADRIIPDCIRAWSKGESVDIRNPNATRPWQHVLEPLSGYLTLGAELNKNKNGNAFNFGPSLDQNYSVQQLIDEMSIYWDNVSWNDISNQNDKLYEAGLLKLNCEKAAHELNWYPSLNFKETVKFTIDWYKTFYNGDNNQMIDFTLEQIKSYKKIASKKGLLWAQ